MGLPSSQHNAYNSLPSAAGLSAMYSPTEPRVTATLYCRPKLLVYLPGDVSAEQMLVVATWAEQFGIGEIRITHEQNFVLHIPPERLIRAGNRHRKQTWQRPTVA